MPVLSNAKQELFAQAVATGKSAREAYREAGYQSKSDAAADANASRLIREDKVASRIAEILGAASEKAGITAERVLAELGKIGFSNMLDYVRVGPDGLPYTDFSALTRDQAAAIAEVTVETVPGLEEDGEEVRPEVKKVKFKLADKRAALTDIGKHLGMFKERVEHTGKDGGPIETKGDVELARGVAFLLAKAAGAVAKEPEPKS